MPDLETPAAEAAPEIATTGYGSDQYASDPSVPGEDAAVANESVEVSNETLIDDSVEAGEQPGEANEQAEADAAYTALIDEATHKGIPADMVESLGDRLQDFLSLMDKQAIALMRSQAPAEPAAEPIQAAPAQPPAQAPAPPQLAALKKLEFKLDPDVHDEDTINAFNAVSEQNNQLVDLLTAVAQIAVENNAAIEKSQTEVQQQTISAETREWDEVFASLPAAYQEIYGTEPLALLAAHDPRRKEREALFAEAKMIKGIDAQAGRAAQGAKERARRALATLNVEKGAAVEREKINKKIAASRRGAIQRPGARSGKPLDPRAKALATIKSMSAQLGIK